MNIYMLNRYPEKIKLIQSNNVVIIISDMTLPQKVTAMFQKNTSWL